MKELLKKKNVIAVVRGRKFVGGVDTGREALVVYVTNKIPLTKLAKEDVVPKTVKGMETDVQESREIRALSRTSKHRPAPGGVSIGHPKITAGTLGMVVKKGGIRHILSNNHVLANGNDAEVGDQTWQPGKADGGTAVDTIGGLIQFVKIRFTGESSCPVANVITGIFNGLAEFFGRATRLHAMAEAANKVDCAISRSILDTDVSDEILEVGKPSGFNLEELKIGDGVKKSGRTSGLNHGTVIGLDGVAKVNYGDKVAVFEDQIFTTAIAQGGDSGSVVLNDNNEVIGLLFAGSDSLTIVNKISNVVGALGLDKRL